MRPWEDRPGEEWLPWPGNPDYQVSNFGRVRLGDDTDQVLSKGMARYEVVQIAGKTKAVHVLVLETFVGPRPKGMWACHNDGDNYNNRLSNLRWDTPKNNFADRDQHGRTARGSRHPISKLTEKDVIRIRESYARFEPQSQIAKRFGVSSSTVSRIVNRTLWKHVEAPTP